MSFLDVLNRFSAAGYGRLAELNEFERRRAEEERLKARLPGLLRSLGQPQIADGDAYMPAGLLGADRVAVGSGLLSSQQEQLLGLLGQQNPSFVGQYLMQSMAPQQQDISDPINEFMQAQQFGLVPRNMTFQDYVQMKKTQPTVQINNLPSAPQGMTYVNDPEAVGGMRLKPLAGSEMSQSQATAAGYADRMYRAELLLNEFENSGVDPGEVFLKARLPLLGVAAMSPDEQRYYQASQDWVRAKLRKESGAVINKDEFADEISTYFGNIGETPESRNQKLDARRQAYFGVAREAGSRYQAKSFDDQFPRTSSVLEKATGSGAKSTPESKLPPGFKIRQ